jgi:hypothetical protein
MMRESLLLLIFLQICVYSPKIIGLFSQNYRFRECVKVFSTKEDLTKKETLEKKGLGG